MTRSSSQRSLSSLFAIGSFLLATATSSQTAQPVSPGAVEGISNVDAKELCFSWVPQDDAIAAHLVIYDESRPSGTDPILRHRLAPAAESWCADARVVLEPGKTYAWGIVTRAAEDGTEVNSSLRRFRADSETRGAELEKLLSEVRARVRKSRAPTDAARVNRSSTQATTYGTARIASPTPRGSLVTEGAAVIGAMPDTSGAVSGLKATTSDSNGFGLIASNTGGGPDLVLGGQSGDFSDEGHLESEAGGDFDIFSQAGFQIRTANPVFEFVDPTPRIEIDDGQVTSPGFGRIAVIPNDGGAGLTNVTAIDLECTGCVQASEIFDNTITSSDFAPGSVGEGKFITASLVGSDFAANSLIGNDFANGSLTASDLGPGSVGASEIAANQVTAAKIAANAVTSAKILAGEVRSPDLASLQLKTVSCQNNGCNDGTLAQVCGAGFRPIYVSCSQVDPFTPTTACGGNNQCRIQQLLGSNSIGDHCVDIPPPLGFSGDAGDALVMCLQN